MLHDPNLPSPPADTRGIETRTYGVDWKTCGNCHVTDPTVSGTPPTHPNVTTCMAVVTKTALGSSTLKMTDQPFVRFDLDPAEQEALEFAVQNWIDRCEPIPQDNASMHRNHCSCDECKGIYT